MENASKALLIAGSVLIALLLIAVGMRVFNSTEGTAEQTEISMQTTEVTMFNNQFLSHIGNEKSKSDVITLINSVIANNSNNTNKMITLSYGGSSYKTISEIQTLMNTIINSTATRFSVSITEYNSSGTIKTIKIQ